jgi:hypothetical protein
MTPVQYKALETTFVEIKRELIFLISSETQEAIEHYLDHAELEMAVELFCLDLMNNVGSVSSLNEQKIFSLVESLGLLEESVFDVHFGEKIWKYTVSQDPSNDTINAGIGQTS